MKRALMGVVIPNARNNVRFERVKTPKIVDRKRHCIVLIQCRLRSMICRQFSRSSNLTLFLAFGIRVLLLYFPVFIWSSPYPKESLTFLGDDYTDSGNYPTTPWTGGSNIWSTFLGIDYGINVLPSSLGGSNYAYALALTNTTVTANTLSILGQTAQLLVRSEAKRRDPVFLFGGANDLIYQTLVPYSPEQSTQNIISILQQLQNQRFKTLFVVNLFDVGDVAENSGIHTPPALLTEQTIFFNALLSEKIAALPFNVFTVDLFSLFDSILSFPSSYGFTNVTDSAPSPQNFSGYLLWFPVGIAQPLTLQFHQIFSDYIFSLIHGAQYYSLLAEEPQTLLRAQNSNLKQQLFPMQLQKEIGRPYAFLSGNYLPEVEPPLDSPGRYRSQGGDFVVGMTERVSDLWTVGGSLGFVFDSSHCKDPDQTCRFDLQAEILSLLASFTPSSGYLNGIINMGFLQFKEIDRRFVTGPLTHHTYGSTHGMGLGATVEGACFVMNLKDSFQTGPLVALEYQRVMVDGYKERGALVGNLVYRDQTTNSLITGLGWEMRLNRAYSSLTLTTNLALSANRQWIEGTREIYFREASLPGSFGVWPISGNAVWFGRGSINFSGTFSSGSSISLGYTLNYGEHNMSESFLTLGLSIPLGPSKTK